MNLPMDSLRKLRIFLTLEHPCSYLPDREARNLVVDPQMVDQRIYNQLIKQGFRRSGAQVYRPHCLSCQVCLSLRIPVSTFKPNRSQRRTLQMNRDIHVRRVAPTFCWDHYRLFQRYLQPRHRDGGMDDSTPEDYCSFLTADWSDTWFYEFYRDEELLAVAVTDQLNDGLSAVYTFFDPDESARGLGTYAVLHLITEAEQQTLPWLYLGYWISQGAKMAYKANFKPYQIFTAGRWVQG